ncbi:MULTISPECIES: hypothetical protein [Pseudomonas]|uniref:hypothetical protein n=1 Tax=Pseudomonas TaxID=286 RepID=UPI001FACB34F|nr:MULTISPECIES: hypothetical protein [Pseudomonas]
MPPATLGIVQHQRSGGLRFARQPGAPEAARRILAHLHETAVGHFHVVTTLECPQAFGVGVRQAGCDSEAVMLDGVASVDHGLQR